MIKISNVLKRDHTLTRQEEWICEARGYAIVYAVVVILLVVCALIVGGLQELTFVFTTLNPISICLVLAALLIFLHFLDGYSYLRRLNKAIKHGVRYDGTIAEIRSEEIQYGIVFYQLGVRLDNGKFVDSPIYKSISPHYEICTVYLYKKKYYFSEFRASPKATLSYLEFWADRATEKMNRNS